jgi:hypothetical protein
MPTYTFESPDGTRVTQRLSFADYDAVTSGEKALVTEDGQELKIVFDPGKPSFNFKDCESGGWPSKDGKERKLRSRRYDEMGKRMKDHAPKTRLIPNYGGQLADRWSDVQDHARTEKGIAAAMTYEPLVAKEKQELGR